MSKRTTTKNPRNCIVFAHCSPDNGKFACLNQIKETVSCIVTYGNRVMLADLRCQAGLNHTICITNYI